MGSSWRRLAEMLGSSAGTTGSWARRFAEGVGSIGGVNITLGNTGSWARRIAEGAATPLAPDVGSWARRLGGDGSSGSWAKRLAEGSDEISALGGGAPFSPASAGTLSMLLDSEEDLFQLSNGTTAAVANNDPVGYWGDQSGTRTPIQATAGSRPLLQTALPSLLFDGTDDYLAYTGALTDTVGSLAIVFKTQAVAFTTARVLISRADEGSATTWFEIGIDSLGRVYIESNAAGTKHTIVCSSFLELATSYMLAVTFDDVDYYVQIGAVEQNPLDITNIGTFAWFGDVAGGDNLVIGGTVTSGGLVRPFKGEILSVALYSTDIT